MWRWLALAAVLALAAAKTVPVSNATLATRACRPGFDTFAFCDTTRSIQERVDDLISRLTDDEITPQLTTAAATQGRRATSLDWGSRPMTGE
jgi:hypothetical protein